MFTTRIGSLELPHFCYNAAGVWGTTAEQCQQMLDTPYCGAVVTKSCTIENRIGNCYPKYNFSTREYSINSNGLENRGVDYYLQNILPINNKPVFYSLGGFSNEERQLLIDRVLDSPEVDIGIELNMSCPNLGKPGPAYKPVTLEEALRKLYENVGQIRTTFGLKMPPFFIASDFADIVDVLYPYHSDINFITCINSVPDGLDYDIDNNLPVISPNGGYGGIGGIGALPIGLANVRRFSGMFKKAHMDVQVIGCGGVSTGADLYKYILAGASAVQVGTELWKQGPGIFTRLAEDFKLIMDRKGYTNIAAIPQN